MAKKFGSKVLVSGVANSGKTSLLKPLKNVFVIARDGKRYPFAQAHVNMPDIEHSKDGPGAVTGIINIINTKLGLYKEKYGALPDTVVFDSISKIFLDIETAVMQKVTSFPYAVINTEIAQLVAYIENTLIPNGINVVLVSHALLDEDTGLYKLVNAGGQYGKKGGVLSEVDQAIFIEAKAAKRVVHHRNLKFISRSLEDSFPDSQPIAEFDLQNYLEVLSGKGGSAAEFEL